MPDQNPPSKLQARVEAAATSALAEQRYVSALHVLSLIGWLPWNLVDAWRQGRFDYLESRLTASPDTVSKAFAHLHAFAEREGLVPTETAYLAATRDRRPLRFTESGDPERERAYRTHWVSSDLSEAKRERLAEKHSKAPDLVVVMPLGDWTCAQCGDTGPFLLMEDDAPHCLDCVDLGHLIFLPSGNATLSRRAKKASGLSAVVIRFNRSRKRYERQGILIEESALELAEEQCLADAEVRERRRERDRDRRAHQDVTFQAAFAREISRLLPGCPTPRAEAIARHAGTRGSGRVGRSAAGRALDEKAITLAVVASIRHEDTEYDSLLMSGVEREAARDRVALDIERVLESWRS